MAQPKTIRVKQTRQQQKPGFTGGMVKQTRVIEVDAEQPAPSGEVTTEEVRDWTTEKD